MVMEAQRFINRYQPQMLVSATVLAYIQAAFDLLSGLTFVFLPLILLAVGKALGGFGIANSKRWGYTLCVVSTIVGIALTLWLPSSFFGKLIGLVFEGALLAMLLHPQSREYQKIWFE